MDRQVLVAKVLQSFSRDVKRRAKVLRDFSKSIGLVYFGDVNQNEDEHDAIRGFTTSLTHRDTHYAVGTYNGYNIRLTDRFDLVRNAGNKVQKQLWTIIELDIELQDLPHVHFVPTGRESGEYGRLYATRPNMVPLNMMFFTNRSPEFHGRYQIIANPTEAYRVESIFTSPVIVKLANRFWPNGIEIERNKLLVYITQNRPAKAALESALESALWLAETLHENRQS